MTSREKAHASYLKNREKAIARAIRYKHSHPDSRKRWNRNEQLRRYGLTRESFNELVAFQEGRCAICKVAFTNTPIIDHDHEKRIVRGLLCRDCNFALGYFEDNARLLQNAIDYLERFRVRQELAAK